MDTVHVPAAEEVHAHEGSFAIGQTVVEHHVERPREKADYAAGQESQKNIHQGCFAAGQEIFDPHPEFLENRGDFASGQRQRICMEPYVPAASAGNEEREAHSTVRRASGGLQ